MALGRWSLGGLSVLCDPAWRCGASVWCDPVSGVSPMLVGLVRSWSCVARLCVLWRGVSSWCWCGLGAVCWSGLVSHGHFLCVFVCFVMMVQSLQKVSGVRR